MSFLLRGRSAWWLRDQSHLPAAEPAPETATAATGLPVAAPAPQGVTDDLSASTRLNLASLRRLEERMACVQNLDDDPVVLRDGTIADRQWVTTELLRLEQLATLTERHGPWVAAQHMYGGAR